MRKIEYVDALFTRIGLGVGEFVGDNVKQFLWILKDVGYGVFNTIVTLYCWSIIKLSSSIVNVIFLTTFTCFTIISVSLALVLFNIVYYLIL